MRTFTNKQNNTFSPKIHARQRLPNVPLTLIDVPFVLIDVPLVVWRSTRSTRSNRLMEIQRPEAQYHKLAHAREREPGFWWSHTRG
jgi:hypothetical protein